MMKSILTVAAVAVAAVAPAQAITPVSVTASSTQRNYSPENLINGSGLSADGLHDGVWSGMWMTEQGQGANQGWLVFDLGATYDLAGADIWQYNFGNPADFPGTINTIHRGVKDFRISTSLDGITFEEVFAGSMDLGTGQPLAANNVAFDATAQFVRFDILDNLVPEGFLNDTYTTYGVGLSEVSFVAAPVPEPATWAMMIAGFGIIGAAMRRRAAAVSFA